MNKLYCVRCEVYEKAYHDLGNGLFHLNTVQVSNALNPGDRYDVEECDFPDGWATVPPPPFDMDGFVETAEPELEDGWGIYGFDVDSDQITTEVYV